MTCPEVTWKSHTLLAARIHDQLTGRAQVGDGVRDLLASIPVSLARELARITHFSPKFIGLFLLTLILAINVIAPVLWLLFGT